MSVTIGHASISEKGTINGAKGDSTGKEVCTRDWYNKPWTAVYRAKNAKVARKIAEACRKACANNYIGYGQNDRLSLYAEAKKEDFLIENIKIPCNADCSSLVAVCCIAAGVPVPATMYTAIEDKCLMNTGMFEKYSTTVYTKKDCYLREGDILLGRGHTAIVLSDGDKASFTYASNYNTELASSYVAKTDVNMRRGAATKYSVVTVVKEGEGVYCYGYYSYYNDSRWLYVQMYRDGRVYTGFINENYLERGV